MKNTSPEIGQAEDLEALRCLEEMRQEPLELRRLDEFLVKFNQPAAITSDQALRIARQDAERVYRALSPYRAIVSLERDGWHVDYEHKDTDVQWGGPHYVIDPEDGAILAKQYEQ